MKEDEYVHLHTLAELRCVHKIMDGIVANDEDDNKTIKDIRSKVYTLIRQMEKRKLITDEGEGNE